MGQQPRKQVKGRCSGDVHPPVHAELQPTSAGGGPSSVSVWPSSSSSGGSGLVGGGCCHTMASWACSLRYRLVRWLKLTLLTTFLGKGREGGRKGAACPVLCPELLQAPGPASQRQQGRRCQGQSRQDRPSLMVGGGAASRAGTQLERLRVGQPAGPWATHLELTRGSLHWTCGGAAESAGGPGHARVRHACASAPAAWPALPHPRTGLRRNGWGHGHFPNLSPPPGAGSPQLTKRRLIHQGLPVQVRPVGHEHLHQVHLWARGLGCC